MVMTRIAEATWSPVCAPESALGWRGGSPLQVQRKPVTDCNCVVARRGGQQQEVNDQSVRSLPHEGGN